MDEKNGGHDSSRNCTPLLEKDSKSFASTIPPHGPKFEQVKGVKPSSLDWKSNALIVVLHLQIKIRPLSQIRTDIIRLEV